LEAYATNNLSVIGAGLIFQEEVTFEQRKVWRYSEEGFTQIHEDGDMKNGVWVKMN
jgi:hypothetical protein